MLMTSFISLYFMILSLDVVLVRDGEAFTSINHGFRLSSMIMSYLWNIIINNSVHNLILSTLSEIFSRPHIELFFHWRQFE